MPLLKKKFETMPEPELVESVSNVQVDEMPGEERIKSRISEIIRSRHAPSAQDVLEQERPDQRAWRGPDALVLGAEPRLTRAERIEPSFLSQPSHWP